MNIQQELIILIYLLIDSTNTHVSMVLYRAQKIFNKFAVCDNTV